MTQKTFPPKFDWGSGTSAYQVEGAWDDDGKVPSIWDTALHSWLKTPDGTSGDTAIGQYHRLTEDLDLLEHLGAKTYRFSASWPRIITNSSGEVNPKGLDYLDRMVDGLLSRGLSPALNLYHWDTPQWLEDLGGMMTREFAEQFGQYAAVLAQRLGDRVEKWFTMNEPVNPSLGGYVAGILPPSRQEGAAGLVSVHHLLLAHGRAIQALRSYGVVGKIGTILSLGGVSAATTHLDDVLAAERAEYFEGRIFLDPMLGRGHLPELAQVLTGSVLPGDMDTIAQPLDVLGVNWYSQYCVAAPHRAGVLLEDVPERAKLLTTLAPITAPLGFVLVPAPGLPWGGAHRQITPGGLRAALDWVRRVYPDHPNLVVTESGIGYSEQPNEHGKVNDQDRIRFLGATLAELGEAIAAGARVNGFHVWSSFDNFQWMAGFSQRFGLIHVDPETLQRTPKASFEWFAQLVANGELPPVPVAEPNPGDYQGVEIAGVRNARGIGGLHTTDGRVLLDGVVFRSAGLAKITKQGRQTLHSLGITTVLDLRSSEESALRPDPVPGVQVIQLPLCEMVVEQQDFERLICSGEQETNSVATPLAAIYEFIINNRGEALAAGVRAIARAGGAVLVHCTIGKDRTGVFIAILLAALGVRDDEIIQTYVESETRVNQAEFREEISAFLTASQAATSPSSPELIINQLSSCPPQAIESMLALIRHDHGTVAQYLRAHGLSQDDLDLVRHRLIGTTS